MFKNLFRKNKVIEDKAFTLDFNDALKRYLGVSNGDIEYSFKDKKGNVIPPSHAFQEEYNQWKNIQSVWDRRGVIFAALDKVYLDRMSVAQIVDRFVLDRYPERAIMVGTKYGKDEDYQDPKFLASLARCHFFLTNFDKSIELAKKALEIDENNKKAQIVLADSLHLSNKHSEAHDIYGEILAKSKLEKWDKGSINVVEIIDFHNDILNSSVYAVGILSNEETDEATWYKASEEFYHCPYFRSQHAFWLAKNGQVLKAIAKIISTTQEFPWFQDAVVNAKSMILQFREQMGSQDLWEDELKYLTQIIEKNNWE